MDRFDFSPLFRSTIGFDRLARLVDAATHVDSAALSYPPYNIEKVGEDAYRLTMAVAGFSRDEIELVVQENTPHRVNPDSLDAGIAWFTKWLKP